jgi:hypothetical protein
VHDEDGRRGEAINSLVSGGCIVSGSAVRNSVLFSNVLVRSYSEISEAVVLPDVQINRHCRLSKVVIDRRCKIPEGLVIGEDPELDAQRFYRTPTAWCSSHACWRNARAGAPAAQEAKPPCGDARGILQVVPRSFLCSRPVVWPTWPPPCRRR